MRISKQEQVLNSCDYINKFVRMFKHMSSLLNQTYIAFCHLLLDKLRSNTTFCGPTLASRMTQHLFNTANTTFCGTEGCHSYRLELWKEWGLMRPAYMLDRTLRDQDLNGCCLYRQQIKQICPSMNASAGNVLWSLFKNSADHAYCI